MSKIKCWLEYKIDCIRYYNYSYELKAYFKYFLHKFGVHDYSYHDGAKLRCRRCGKVKR